MVNIRVLDSTLGTITNAEGSYRLILPRGSYRIVFSCMGFNSDTLHVSLGEETVHRDVSLERATLMLPDLIVYPETGNPAEDLIRQAIARKQAMFQELHTYRFDAYTRTKIWAEIMREGVREPEIVGLLETQTRGYWKAPDHYLETITARRQSATFTPAQNILTSGLLPNFMKDRIVAGPNNVVGPLADKALDYYSYSMIDTTVADGRSIYRVKVEPKFQHLPLFQGTMAIADGTFLLMQVDMSGNEAMNARPIVDWRFQQQFASYEEKYWFPISSFFQFRIDLGVDMPIHAEMHAVLYDYGINEELPRGLFGRYRLQVEPTADEPDSTAWQGLQILPLTEEETAAYAQIEKDMEEAGPLGRFILALINGISGTGNLRFTAFSDFFHFNRVEGLYLGAGFALKEPIPRTNLTLKAGYGFDNKQGKYGIEVERILSRSAELSVGAVSEHVLAYREGAGVYTPGEITAYAFFDNVDPVDYYARRGWNTWLRARPWGSLGLELRYRSEFHGSVEKHIDKSFLYRSKRYRDNSPVMEGRLRSASVMLDLDTRKFYNTGRSELPLEDNNWWRIQSELEISQGAGWKSDFTFRRAILTIRRHQFTFGPGHMLVVLRGGYSTGRLPPQRLFDLIGGVSGWYKPECFMTLNPREYAGDRMGMMWVEHNFGSMPLRAIGIRPTGLLDIDLLLRAAGGWCGFRSPEDGSLTYEDKAVEETHWEVGLGIGRIYTFLRLDFAWRLTSRQGRVFVISIGGGF